MEGRSDETNLQRYEMVEKLALCSGERNLVCIGFDQPQLAVSRLPSGSVTSWLCLALDHMRRGPTNLEDFDPRITSLRPPGRRPTNKNLRDHQQRRRNVRTGPNDWRIRILGENKAQKRNEPSLGLSPDLLCAFIGRHVVFLDKRAIRRGRAAVQV